MMGAASRGRGDAVPSAAAHKYDEVETDRKRSADTKDIGRCLRLWRAIAFFFKGMTLVIARQLVLLCCRVYCATVDSRVAGSGRVRLGIPYEVLLPACDRPSARCSNAA